MPKRSPLMPQTRLTKVPPPAIPLPYPVAGEGLIQARLRAEWSAGQMVLAPSSHAPVGRAIGFSAAILAFVGLLVLFWFSFFYNPPFDLMDKIGMWFGGIILSAISLVALAIPFDVWYAQRRERRRGPVLILDRVRSMMTLCRVGISIPIDRVIGFEVIDGALTDPNSESGSRVLQVLLVYEDEAGEPWRRLLWVFDAISGPPAEPIRQMGLDVRLVTCRGEQPKKFVLEKRAPLGSVAYASPLGRSRTIEVGPNERAVPVPLKCGVCEYEMGKLAAGYVCPECGFNHFDVEVGPEVPRSGRR